MNFISRSLHGDIPTSIPLSDRIGTADFDQTKAINRPAHHTKNRLLPKNFLLNQCLPPSKKKNGKKSHFSPQSTAYFSNSFFYGRRTGLHTPAPTHSHIIHHFPPKHTLYSVFFLLHRIKPPFLYRQNPLWTPVHRARRARRSRHE